MDAVSGGCPQDHIFEHGAVFERKKRRLTLVLATRTERTDPDETLHAAIKGAGNVDRV